MEATLDDYDRITLDVVLGCTKHVADRHQLNKSTVKRRMIACISCLDVDTYNKIHDYTDQRSYVSPAGERHQGRRLCCYGRFDSVSSPPASRPTNTTLKSLTTIATIQVQFQGNHLRWQRRRRCRRATPQYSCIGNCRLSRLTVRGSSVSNSVPGCTNHVVDRPPLNVLANSLGISASFSSATRREAQNVSHCLLDSRKTTSASIVPRRS
ncbi:hypothetical protein T4D_4173 [Trichinella pseudospiralis]|uniref:Uncharacterized protein n=1 Tax=Trichinella pseudospiralis TaxID=6337 RepID=A0A0V1FTJ1_TRIPS|nr:hypothetical protein T4D_4173 [Trichinella pseudospiralis]